MKKQFVVRAENDRTGEVWEISVKCRSRYRAVKKLIRKLHWLTLSGAAGMDYRYIEVMEVSK